MSKSILKEKALEMPPTQDASERHQRGVPTDECAVESQDTIDGRAAIFQSSAGMTPGQFGRDDTDLKTTRLIGISIIP